MRVRITTGKGAQRRGGRTQHERAAMHLRQACGHLAGMVARGARLLVAALVLLVDDVDARISKRGEKRRARAHHHAGAARTHKLPLIAPLTQREAGVQHGHGVAEAVAEAPHRLGGKRDLGNEHTRALAGRKGALDGLEVHLSLARAGHAVDEHDAALPLRTGVFDGAKRAELPRGEVLQAQAGSTRTRKLRDRRPAQALLAFAGHDALFLQALDDRGDSAHGKAQLHLAHRAFEQRLHNGALGMGVLAGLIGAALLGDMHPAVVDRLDAGLLEGPDTRRLVAHHLGRKAGGQKQTDGVCQRGRVFLCDPLGDIAGLGQEQSLGEHLLDGKQTRTCESRVERLVHRKDVPDCRAAAKLHHHAAAGHDRGFKASRNGICEGRRERPGLYVNRNARERHRA